MLFERRKPLDLILETAAKRSLTRQLNAFDLTMLGIGAVIGTGIFVIIGEGIGMAGPAVILSFILAAVTCVFSALCYAELASSIPVSGSASEYALPPMWGRRSSTSTRLSSSDAARSATVRPKKPDPTTTRSYSA